MKKLIIVVLLVLACRPGMAQEKFIVVQDAPMSCYYFLPFIDYGDQNNYDCIYNVIYGIDKEYTLTKYNIMEAISKSPFVDIDKSFNYKIDYYITHIINNGDTVPCDTMIVSDFCMSNTDFNSRLYGTNPKYKKDKHITRCTSISEFREHERNMLMLLLHESIIDVRMTSDADNITKIVNQYTQFIEKYFGEYINIPQNNNNKKIPHKDIAKVKKWTETENLQFKHLYD